MKVDIKDLLTIYEKEVSKNVKNKRKIYNFEINKMMHLGNIKYMLENKMVGHKNYNIFLIYEPKCRLVMSLSVQDKIINHYIARFILEPKLEKYLDIRNCATRKKMGTDYAIRLVKKYLEKNKKYNNIYVLKMDISKYFYSIDHKVLKSLLKGKLDDYEYNLVSMIIDSTNEKYINEKINRLKGNRDIPLYESGKGLPIGNMTSQALSIFYLSGLDHYIIHNLKCKYYVRYMDDFIIIDNDLDKLKLVKRIIIEKLEKEYLLKVNEKKTVIVNIKNSFSFLGYTFKIMNNKTIIKIKSANYEKIKKKVKRLKYLLDNNKISYNKAFCSIMTYLHLYKYANNRKIIKVIDRYFYDK